MQLAFYDKIFVLEGVFRSLFPVNLKIAKLLLILMLLHPWRRIFLNLILFFLFGMFCLTCGVRNLTNESLKLLRKVANRLSRFELKNISRQWKPFDLREVCSNVSILHDFRLIAIFWLGNLRGILQRLQLDLVSDHQTCELSFGSRFHK